jgi:anthraniloyl-CoA monooxygenase
MKIVCIGGGPAGLYFGILMKKANPLHDITILERNRREDTFGFGVVFSDATMGNLEEADRDTYHDISRALAHWDDIDIHVGGRVLTSTGHGFSGMSRKMLLGILSDHAERAGITLQFETEVSDVSRYTDADLVFAADGVNSMIRAKYAEHFRPLIKNGSNRFVWLGTTFPFKAFTFYFKQNDHGLFRVHAYRYDEQLSTFIVECTADTYRRAGLKETDEDATIAYCEELFAEELEGHRLLKNRSFWRNFPNIKNERWHYRNIVLAGDAAHTAHFSIGSGTKLAMEDSIALARHLGSGMSVEAALEAYDQERRPTLESTQRAAEVSLSWFENTERYMSLDPTQFAFSLLTRSLRVTHENLRVRDPAFVAQVDDWFAGHWARATGSETPHRADGRAVPPMLTPYHLRALVLSNRIVVSPMCQYSADDGTVGDWHLVHLGSRSIGGAGLMFTEMTDVSREGRISPGCAGMYKPEHVAAWKRIVDFIHANGGTKIGIQLAHAGRKGSTRLAWEGSDQPLDGGNWPLIAPSPIPYFPHSQVPREMTRADMDTVRDQFVRAAGMADEAGFDILELHYAHGYLLASFLSPLTNIRKDQYGGTLENRMRWPLEVFEAVRTRWPQDKPMSVRISATDWYPGGFEADDAVVVARALKALGCDIIDVSSGQTIPDQRPTYGRLFQTPFAERIRLEARVPTMTVGNISSYSDVNTVLAAGRADLCVLARAHLFDPYWTRHAARDLGVELAWPPQYEPVRRFVMRFK